MLTFVEWMNESFTEHDEKLNQIARRIWSNIYAIVEKKKKTETFEEFKKWAAGQDFSQPKIYGWLTQRISGFEERNPENTKKLNDMIQTMASVALPPEVEYSDNGGDGWHHWIIKGDAPRGEKGTDKVYISVDWQSLLPNAKAVMSTILKNLVHNNFYGQIKIHKYPDGWLKRMDNIVMHSSSPEYAEFGGRIVKQILDNFKVKISGGATSGYIEKGLDPKAAGTSFNDYAAEVAFNGIVQILKQTTDYDHFMRNIQNYFAPNGGFTQSLKSVL